MSSVRRPLLLAVLGLLMLLGMGADAARKFSVDTSMEHFLPGSGERKLYRISRELIDSTLTSRMVLTLGLRSSDLGREERRAILLGASEPFLRALEKLDGLSSVTRGPPAGVEESFFELYFPRRFAYFSLAPEREVALRFSTERLRADARRLKDALASPEGTLVRSLAPRDPWMLFYDFVTQAGQSALRLDISEGQFFAHPHPGGVLSADEDFAIFFVELRDSALDSSAQAPLLRELNAAFARVVPQHDSRIFLEASGANRFAVATERSMKQDIERVLTLSTLGILLLFLLFFRSPKRILFLLLPVTSGVICAVWATLTLFGDVHALTLAFGGALIGVALDYPVHTLCHHDLGPAGTTDRETRSQLLPTLGLAAGTTILGLGGLGFAGFPGIREIAVFSAIGITAALVTTLLSAGLLAPLGRKPDATRFASELLLRAYRSFHERKAVPVLIILVACALSLTGLSKLRFAPGLESLAPLDPKLLAEDERVQGRIGQDDSGTLVISLGANIEDALQKNEEVSLVLERAVQDGLLGRFESVATLLRSQRLQTRSQAAAQAAPRLAERTWDALKDAGFVASGFSELPQELARPVVPLTKAALDASPLAPLIAPFFFQVEDEVAIITPIGQVRDIAKLEKRFDSVPGAHVFSQKALLNSAYSDLRARTTDLLLVGLLLVFAAGLLRYRSFKKAAALLFPAVLAGSGTVGLLALVGVELNLLHLLALLLVSSMGVDYTVFLLDSAKNPQPALLSITIGCLSTVLTFGALGLSSAPALRALGLTITIGIAFSLLLAPTALLMLPKQTRAPTLR